MQNHLSVLYLLFLSSYIEETSSEGQASMVHSKGVNSSTSPITCLFSLSSCSAQCDSMGEFFLFFETVSPVVQANLKCGILQYS